MKSTVLVWFRHDLRLDDNPALFEAAQSRARIIPVFIWSPDEEGKWMPGSATRFWLHHALQSLQSEIEQRESRLILRQGPALQTLMDLLKETGADSLFWNRRYEPDIIKRDKEIKQALQNRNINARSFNSHLLFEPHQINNKRGSPFKVYTPFWRHYQTLDVPLPLDSSDIKYQSPQRWPKSLKLEQLKLIPRISWYREIENLWDMRIEGAQTHIKGFIANRIMNYSTDRDIPAIDGVSGLSPYLHFGQISSRRIWQQVLANEQQSGRVTPSKLAQAYLRQLVWRDFAHHLLYHYPDTTDQPMYDKFRRFPWQKNKKLLQAWQRGKTGYPIVDAGMRQLWQTGWMHNRVRMIAGSFLTKDLMIAWQSGAEWFWDTLVDADLANNTMGWQWVAGCGADAAPYFRIFNPVLQGQRYDADGAYIRRWIPELKKLDNKYIHQPWQAPTDILNDAGIIPGKTYPLPIVDHAVARDKALGAYQQIRQFN